MKLGLIYNPQNARPVEEGKYSGLGFRVALAARMVDDPGMAYMNKLLKTKQIGGTVIMTPYAPPMSKPVDPATVVRFLKLLEPDLFILPDRKIQVDHPFLKNTSPNERIYVPYGRDPEEVIRNYISDSKRFTWAGIGLPSKLERLENDFSDQGRVIILDQLLGLFPNQPLRIFILGINEHPKAEIEALLTTYPFIEAVITSAPIAYAQQNKQVTDRASATLGWDVEANFHTVQRNVRAYQTFLIKAARNARKEALK